MTDSPLTLERAEALARLALECIDREYPNHVVHLLNSDADALPPRELTPVFFGCFDWHSAVHGHWTLVRLLDQFPNESWSRDALTALEAHFTPDRILGEQNYLNCPQRAGFERPYGLAWLLQLVMECRESSDPQIQNWAARLSPLETLAKQRFATWLPKLTNPVRSGEHSQTAFALGLVFDWAIASQDAAMKELITERSLVFYQNDKQAPLAYEPSGHDFLSPVLAEADLFRRLLPPDRFAAWLSEFLPSLSEREHGLNPVTVSDPSDGKLAHLDGLNLSRAWMLEGIAHGLPKEDSRREIFLRIAQAHVEAGIASVTGEHYAGGHWLGTFAVYLLTKRGLNLPD